MKNLLVLGASSLQVPLLHKAKALGYRTIALDMSADAPGASVADEFYQISTIDAEKVLLLAREKQISGIVTTSDYPVRVVAFVSSALGLAGPTPAVAEICTNKFLQRQILMEKGFPCPKFKLLKYSDELAAVSDWDFPLIIKPVDSSASRGVQKVEVLANLPEAYELARSNSKSGDVIVEEYIEGKEYSVEVLVQDKVPNIVAITEKVTAGFEGRFFVEEMHIVPATLTREVERQVEAIVTSFITELGLNDSAAHVEVKVNDKGAFIIEAAARLGGDFITSNLVPLATGVDMLKEIISLSTSRKIAPWKTRHMVAGIHFVTPENLQSARSHIEKIRNLTGVEEIFFDEGKTVGTLKSSLDRLGHLIVRAEDRQQLDKLLLF